VALLETILLALESDEPLQEFSNEHDQMDRCVRRRGVGGGVDWL
jgi:hypothetical protein